MNRQSALEAHQNPTSSASNPNPATNLTADNNQAQQNHLSQQRLHHHQQQQQQQLLQQHQQQRQQLFPHDNTNAYQSNLHAQQQQQQQDFQSPQRQLQASAGPTNAATTEQRSGKSNVPDNATQANFFTATAAQTANKTFFNDDQDAIQMTRAAHATPTPAAANPTPPMASASNPYGQNSGSSKLDYSSYALTPTRKSNNNNNNNNQHQQQRMSKTHAHSTSLLASDSYMACMSSDSEISGATRHHHRPYSSQSRVYHAHLAPKSSPASSRMSHYSDPAASTYTSTSEATSQQQQQQQQLQQQQQQIQKQQPPHYTSNVARQGSLSSSGSGGSGSSSAAYLALTDPPMSSLQQQQQTGSLSSRASSGSRQLPHHRQPFKQSMSIDHHSTSQYHHQPLGHHQMGHLSSPAAHSMSPQYELNEYHSQQAQHYPTNAPILALSQRSQSQASQQYPLADQRYGQRNFRLEMELLDKQTANMNIYDNELAPVPPQVGLPPTAARLTPLRQLPPITPSSNMGATSVEHSQQQQDPYHPSQTELQQSQHQQPKQQQHHHHHHHQQQQQQKNLHHQQDAYAAHQVMSTPSEWLPPMGIANHHLNRTSGPPFKQAMSIDHYSSNSSQQRLQQHYSPARSHLGEHFRGSLNYVAGPPGSAYESPTRQLHYQSVSPEVHGDIIYQQYVQEQNQNHQQQQQPSYQVSSSSQLPQGESHAQQHDTNQPCSTVSSNLIQSQAKGSATPAHRSNLQHQISSSSSNSGQSGSLRSSNVEINKSLSEHQKTGTLSHFQHQQSPQHRTKYDQHKQGTLRKGYTPVVPSLSGSGAGFNEPLELSSSPSSALGHSGSGAVHISSHISKRSALRAASPSATPEATTSLGAQQHHHSASTRDGAGSCGTRSESSTGLINGANSSSSLTKKSNSATQLSMTGTKKRLGFRKKQVTSFSVHRSEEVAPLEARHLVKQGSSVSEGDSSMSGDSSSRSWSNSNFKPQTSEELASMSFIDGLGKGQMISRQGLASPYLGDIQLSLCDRRGNLEIEVIRARNLQAKTNKILPLTYVKLYLVKNRKCLAKAKTTLSNKRTLDPLFQQQLTFHEDYHGCILQSIIWGNFGKMDKKNFMGIAQISIDDLELSDTVISWYKLFLPSSLQTLPSKSLRHTLLSNSTESFTNLNNS